MATVTGYTAAHMDTISDTTVIDGTIVGNDLILVTRDGTEINAGNVRGPVGPIGATGPLTKAMADGYYVDLTGDVMTGRLTIDQTGGTGEALKIIHGTSPYASWFKGTTRIGYIQAQSDEFRINSENDNPMTFFTNGKEQLRLRVGTTAELLTLNGNPDCLVYFRQSIPSGTVFSYIGKSGSWGFRATSNTDALLQATAGDTRIQASASVDFYPGNAFAATMLPNGGVLFSKEEVEDDVPGFYWHNGYKDLRLVTNVNGAASIYLNRQGGATGTGGAEKYMLFDMTGTEAGSIARSPTGVAYNNTSDYRIKNVKGPLTNALERIKVLKPVRAVYNSDVNKTEVDTFVAHEVAEVVPEAVGGVKDGVDSLGNPVYQQLDVSRLVPLLVASIQELSAQVDELKANLAPA